ncbi:MAG: amino acid--tRNA ligase-related protein [Saprospiraceae bacterium]
MRKEQVECLRVTTFDLTNPPKTETGRNRLERGFLWKTNNLTVSGQLEAEIGLLALGKVYTFGPEKTFRAENSNTTRHLAEFWMIEPEVAFFDIHDDMDLAEEFCQYLIRYVLENYEEDVQFLDQRIQNLERICRQMIADRWGFWRL